MEPKNQKICLFWCFEPISKQPNQQNCFEQTETNQNNSKFSQKYQNMLSIKLFWLVFCLFQFSRNIKTLCFGIEWKQPKQTVSKQTKTNRNNPKFSEKNTKMCSLSNCFRFLFCLFRFNGNTESLCFGINAKQPKQIICFR
jgi:hypothetical protein